MAAPVLLLALALALGACDNTHSCSHTGWAVTGFTHLPNAPYTITVTEAGKCSCGNTATRNGATITPAADGIITSGAGGTNASSGPVLISILDNLAISGKIGNITGGRNGINSDEGDVTIESSAIIGTITGADDYGIIGSNVAIQAGATVAGITGGNADIRHNGQNYPFNGVPFP